MTYMLKVSSKDQFTVVKSTHADDDGSVTCWTQAAQYMLRTYDTLGTIREAILTFRDTHQNTDKDERSYAARLSTAAARIVNVHSADLKITLYVDGFNEPIKTLMVRYQ